MLYVVFVVCRFFMKLVDLFELLWMEFFIWEFCRLCRVFRFFFSVEELLEGGKSRKKRKEKWL